MRSAKVSLSPRQPSAGNYDAQGMEGKEKKSMVLEQMEESSGSNQEEDEEDAEEETFHDSL